MSIEPVNAQIAQRQVQQAKLLGAGGKAETAEPANQPAGTSDAPAAADMDAARTEGLDREEFRRRIEEMVKSAGDSQPALSFKVDEYLEKVVVEVKDRETGEIIRQIPSEEILEMAKKIKEMNASGESRGLVLSKTV